MRLDLFLSHSRNITRNRAQFLISEGLVSVNGKQASKASYDVTDADEVNVQEDRRVQFVSRSAIKLDSFLEEIGLDVAGCDCLDIGASTGGFTQVLLMRHARSVTAVDVGTMQLHSLLRSDPRVISVENTDIRDFATTPSSFRRHPFFTEGEWIPSPSRRGLGWGEKDEEFHGFNLIVGDISFISLTKLIDSILLLATPLTRGDVAAATGGLIEGKKPDLATDILLLYKPQFEVGNESLRKTGVPKSEAIVAKKFHEFQEFLVAKWVEIKKISPSAIEGEAGNREWMMWIKKVRP